MRNVPSRVTDSEASRLDTTDSGGPDDENAPLASQVQDLSGMPLRNTLGDQSDRLDLRELEGIEGAGVHTSGTGEVDEHVDLGVLSNGLLERSVDRKESLLGSPVELLDVVTTEWVDHGGDTGGVTSARVVEVQHALDGAGLQTIYEGSSGIVERPEIGASAVAGGGLREVDDLIAGLDALSVGLDSANRGASLDLRRLGSRSRGDAVGNGLVASLHAESEGNNLRDVSLGTVHLNRHTQRLSKKAHGLQTLLVVGATTTNEDLDAVVDQLLLVLLEGTDDTLEGGSDVGEVGNTTTNDENLALGIDFASGDQVDYGKVKYPV